MAKAVKLADIATKFGVSTVTVSKALSGQKGVSEEMRARIKAYADELGYKQPSAYRKEMSEAQYVRGYNLGVIIADYYLGKYESFYSQMYQQFMAKAGSRGSFCLLELISAEQERNLDMPLIVQDSRVDGIVVIGRLNDDYLRLLRNSGIPVVGMDFYTSDPTLDSVVSDGYYGAYRMTNYLFEKGHRDIAYVGTLGTTPSIMDRYMGYLRSLSFHGVPLRQDWIIEDRDNETWVLDAERYLELPEEMPTAFVCNSDQTAGCLIEKLQAKGYRVPEDISVVGYDNFLPPGICNVRITTYEVDMREMAERVLTMITNKISGERYKKGTLVVEGHIVEKESVNRR